VRGVRAYEFGAGWDLIGPLAFRMLGVERQVLVDIRPSLRAELVEDTLRRFAELHPELERRAGRPLEPLGRPHGSPLPELLERFGIEYLAPCDARATGLPAASFDLISSTYTLEHVPPDDIVAILRECRRLLAPGGVLSCTIDLQDHYAFDDSRISVYNFLRYSERTWRLVNSSLHHQNRLRMPEHLALFAAAGLTVLDVRADTPETARADLAAVPVHPEIARRHAPEDLAVTSIVVAATAPTSVSAPRIPQRLGVNC
jgi:SAM-dependent methyltransferase